MTPRTQRRRAFAAALAIGVVALLGGCATPPLTQALLESPPASLRAPVRLDSVPFFPQSDYQCGPAALAMVLQASGVEATPEQLVPQVFVPARAGSLQPEMLAAARRHGRLAVQLPPQLDAVLSEVKDGNPVIVLQNLSLPFAPVWHYAVVIGFDLGRAEIILHSGLTARDRIPLPLFERTWARSNHWAMVAAPPAQLPRSVAPEALLAAAAALERVDAEAALRSYVALTRREPRLAAAWFAAGNAAFSAGRVGAAARFWRRATTEDPQFADAWNNLAQALLALGRTTQARAAAQRAVQLGGARIERYRHTQQQIAEAASRSR